MKSKSGDDMMEWKGRCPSCGYEFVTRFPTYELTTTGIKNRFVNMDPCYECSQCTAGFKLVEVLDAPGCVKA